MPGVNCSQYFRMALILWIQKLVFVFKYRKKPKLDLYIKNFRTNNLSSALNSINTDFQINNNTSVLFRFITMIN